MKTKSSVETFIKYLGVGAVNTAIWFFTMVICAYIYDNYLFYTAVGYITSLITSFVLNLHFTFQVSGAIAKRAFFFFLINLTNVGIVQIIQYVLIEHYHWHEYAAITAGITWYTFSGFWANQRYVFHRSSQSSSGEKKIP